MICTPIGKPSAIAIGTTVAGSRRSSRDRPRPIGGHRGIPCRRRRSCGLLGLRVVVGKGGRRGRRADDHIEVLEQDAPSLLQPLTGEIKPEQFPSAEQRPAHQFGDEALVGGGNLLRGAAHLLILVVRHPRRQEGVQELDVKPRGRLGIGKERRLAFDVGARGGKALRQAVERSADRRRGRQQRMFGDDENAEIREFLAPRRRQVEGRRARPPPRPDRR